MRSLQIKRQNTERTETFNIMLNEISKYKPLSPEEQAELFKNIKEGCQKSRDKMFKHNLRFVVSVAKGYRNRAHLLNDVFQEGSIGLFKAIDRYEPERGFRFISYAVWWIRQSIQEFLRKNEGEIKKPTQKIFSSKIQSMDNEFFEHFGTYPTNSDYELFFDLSNDEKLQLKRSFIFENIAALDAPISDDESHGCLGSIVPADAFSPDEIFESKEEKQRVDRYLKKYLSKRQVEVFSKYNVIFSKSNKPTLQDVGKELGVSREFVRQTNEQAKEILKKSLKKHAV